MALLRRLALGLGCALLVGGCGGSPASPPTTPSSSTGTTVTDLGTAFQVLSAKAIYFGHQSVGSNIMTGVQALIGATPGVTLRVVNTSSAAAMTKGVFAHGSTGDNGDPFGKTAAFVATIQGGVGGRVDIAFFKYCYVDFDESTGVDALFSDYQSRMAGLKAAYPGVRFVFVTVPLVTGANAINTVRERFSERIRQAYPSGEVFDLARIEATRPDGSTEAFNGVRALVPSYSSDGGHLNSTGQSVVARALVLFLASL